MTVTSYSGWVQDGQPWRPSNPSQALSRACEAHGVGYGILGDLAHLQAVPPEDHCPYSATSWPGSQPYPYVLAVDLMTTDPAVARRIIEAKRSGRLPCVKYMNWTDEQGACWHTRWEFDEQTSPSSDRGHIHLSFLSNHFGCMHAAGFDPFTDTAPTPPQGDEMLTHWVDVQQGSTGYGVRVAQSLLLLNGLPVGSPDGRPDGQFGPTTDRSTRSYQSMHGLTPDGIFGPHTLSVALYGHDYA